MDRKTVRPVRAVLILLAVGTVSVCQAQQQDEAQSGLVGTWTLTAAQRDVGGEPARIRGAHGLLVIDSLGNVFEFLETPLSSGAADTSTERQRAFAEFGGFWGRYAIPSANRIDFQAEAGVSPNVRGLSFSRSFELDGERLVTVSADEPQAQAHMQLTWQRVPPVENLSPTYSQVVGFWRHVDERRVDLATGEVLSVRQRGPSMIVYTPAGYFGVHFPEQDRAPFAEDAPSPEEAEAAFQGYIGYFGALGVYPGEVAHNVMSGTQPSAGAILRRFAAIDGDEAVLTIPSIAREPGAARLVTTVNMRRLSGLDEMLPRP